MDSQPNESRRGEDSELAHDLHLLLTVSAAYLGSFLQEVVGEQPEIDREVQRALASAEREAGKGASAS
jgi:hypothetical protein